MELLLTHSLGTDPAENLALEEGILETIKPGQIIFYLWQNQHTVVVGRHQNPWRECRVQLLEQEGGQLVRRTSGGGAVYHDLGNLNFSFLMHRPLYDLDKQLGTILAAVRSFGIPASFSGRNDLLVEGKKFSGNAFAFRTDSALHHGTLMLRSDHDRVARYLQVSQQKMASKGISSVQSRVTNLCQYVPDLTVSRMEQALAEAFAQSYGGQPQTVPPQSLLPQEQWDALTARHRSWDWRFGQTPSFDLCLEHRFPWGEIQLSLSSRDGRITEAACHSDAMDEAFISRIAPALLEQPFQMPALSQALRQLGGPQAEDLSAWLAQVDV